MKEKKQDNLVFGLFLRYFIIILASLGNLFLFYKLFTPLTVNLVSFLLNLVSETRIIEGLILFKTTAVEIIPACVAGSAYYLLFILCMSISNIKIAKRFLLILFSFGLLLILNVFRIFFLVLINQSVYFESLHMLFWYILSTVFVFLIWIVSIKLFKINQIPVYDDVKFLITLTKSKNTKKFK